MILPKEQYPDNIQHVYFSFDAAFILVLLVFEENKSVNFSQQFSVTTEQIVLKFGDMIHVDMDIKFCK